MVMTMKLLLLLLLLLCLRVQQQTRGNRDNQSAPHRGWNKYGKDRTGEEREKIRRGEEMNERMQKLCNCLGLRKTFPKTGAMGMMRCGRLVGVEMGVCVCGWGKGGKKD